MDLIARKGSANMCRAEQKGHGSDGTKKKRSPALHDSNTFLTLLADRFSINPITV